MRGFFVRYLWAFIGLAYRYGGNGILGIDCSGLVCEGLRAVGIISKDMSALGLWLHFRAHRVNTPDEGVLVFFGTQTEITHVAVCLGNGLMIEAGGGVADTDTPQEAEQRGAMVRVRPLGARRDLVGFADPF